MSGKLIAFGTFDLFHVGHVRFLGYCSNFASEVIIALSTDNFVREHKGPPVLHYWQRAALLRELGYQIVPRDITDIKGICAEHNPDAIAWGSDWALAGLDHAGIDLEYLERNDIALFYFPNDRLISSSKIRDIVKGGG